MIRVLFDHRRFERFYSRGTEEDRAEIGCIYTLMKENNLDGKRDHKSFHSYLFLILVFARVSQLKVSSFRECITEENMLHDYFYP